MTISSSTFRRILLSAAVFFICTLPTSALADIKIVDVMYNPPGNDQGHEWIEIENTGTSTSNLTGYRLFEGGVNHKLAVAVGTSSLTAGAKAIITTDPGQYAADYPSFAGAIFKSSFSLLNSGDTIELKDPALAVVDTYSYTAPPVVKAPAAKAASSSAKKYPASAYKAGDEQAAAPAASLPALPAVPSALLYGFGLVTLLILGAGAALYARPAAGTNGSAKEFELE